MTKQEARYYATGRRKSAQARVYLSVDSKDEKIINKIPFNNYFKEVTAEFIVNQPFEVTGTKGKFSLMANVSGGGYASQAEAVRHGISRALLEYDSTLRPALKKQGLLTRDAREKERKKYGQKGARARYQFSKR